MNVACVFLKNSLNLPVTEGHFIIVSKNSIDVLCLQNDATKLKCYENEIPIHHFLYIIGQIVHGNVVKAKAIGMTRVEFFLPLKKFLPTNANSHIAIISGPCASIKELIKTPYIGCMKYGHNGPGFVFSLLFLKTVMHAVAAGMDNVFVCHYINKDAN